MYYYKHSCALLFNDDFNLALCRGYEEPSLGKFNFNLKYNICLGHYIYMQNWAVFKYILSIYKSILNTFTI